MKSDFQSSNYKTRTRKNRFDEGFNPKLKNSPYLEPPKMIPPPKPPESNNHKASPRKNQPANSCNLLYPNYNQYFPGYSPNKTPRVFRPYQKGKTYQYSYKRSLFLRTSNNNNNFDDNFSNEEQKKSPYNEDQLEMHQLAKQRTQLRMKEQEKEDRKERIKINKESAEAIKIEKQFETETSDLIFAKHDHGIRIIPSFDRKNQNI